MTISFIYLFSSGLPCLSRGHVWGHQCFNRHDSVNLTGNVHTLLCPLPREYVNYKRHQRKISLFYSLMPKKKNYRREKQKLPDCLVKNLELTKDAACQKRINSLIFVGKLR